MKIARVLSYLVCFMLLGFLWCSTSTPNEAPVIKDVTVNPEEIMTGAETTVFCDAEDPDEDDLTYSWTDNNKGRFPYGAASHQVKWKAPEVGGTYWLIVTVTDGKKEVKDSISVSVIEQGQLRIEGSSVITFGEQSTTSRLFIYNSGTDVLNWTATPQENWFSCLVCSGTLSAGGRDTLEFTCDRSQFESGDYSSKLNLDAGEAGNFDIDVTMRVNANVQVSTNNLDFGATDKRLTVNVFNTGSGKVRWTVEIDPGAPWISTSPTDGLTGERDTTKLIVSVERTNLSPKEYNGYFRVNAGAFGVRTVNVRMVVTSDAILSLNVDTLDYGRIETQKTFKIRNIGTGELNWEVSTDKTWITVNPNYGSTKTEEDVVTVTVSRQGLTPSTEQKGWVFVEADYSGMDSIFVKLIVPGPNDPAIDVSLKNLDFGFSATQITVQVQNKGSGTINWRATESESWLAVAPSNGSCTKNQPSNVDITLDRDQMTSGRFEADILFEDIDGLAGEITVHVVAFAGAGSCDLYSEDFKTQPDDWQITQSMTAQWSRNDENMCYEVSDNTAGVQLLINPSVTYSRDNGFTIGWQSVLESAPTATDAWGMYGVYFLFEDNHLVPAGNNYEMLANGFGFGINGKNGKIYLMVLNQRDDPENNLQPNTIYALDTRKTATEYNEPGQSNYFQFVISNTDVLVYVNGVDEVYVGAFFQEIPSMAALTFTAWFKDISVCLDNICVSETGGKLAKPRTAEDMIFDVVAKALHINNFR